MDGLPYFSLKQYLLKCWTLPLVFASLRYPHIMQDMQRQTYRRSNEWTNDHVELSWTSSNKLGPQICRSIYRNASIKRRLE